MTASVQGVINEIESHLECFKDYVDVSEYEINMEGRGVPTIVVQFPSPEKKYSGLKHDVSSRLKAISMGLSRPYIQKRESADFDFEKGFENVLYDENIPLEVERRQKIWQFERPMSKDQARLGQFGCKFEEKPQQDVYDEIKRRLDESQPYVYRPRRLPEKGQMVLDMTGISPCIRPPKFKQARLHEQKLDRYYECEVGKSYVTPRVGDLVRQINDLIYVFKFQPLIMTAEVKPWSSRAPADMYDRYGQLRRYDVILKANGFTEDPMCLMIPSFPTLTEVFNMERFAKKSGRPTFILTVGEQGYVAKNVLSEAKRCRLAAERAEKAGLTKAAEIFREQHEKFSSEVAHYRHIADALRIDLEESSE